MIGQTLSHYRITSHLGEGGMGVVYQADDLTLNRPIALKVLPPELAGSQERFERFQREAKTLAAIDHPNIVHIYSVESADPEDGGPPVHFLTMQLVKGKLLSEVIPPDGMAADHVIDIASQLAAALGAAHVRGITHRDLKPANVMVDEEGRVKVLDFGLAKLRVPEPGPDSSQLPTEAMTQEGLILGTIPYMSPEQVEGQQLDHRSDIFSLGVMMHQMAAGKHPFSGRTSAAMAGAILRDEPSSISEINPELPESLGNIVSRCMEKDPEARYASASELQTDLGQLRESIAAGAVMTGAQGQAHRAGSRVPIGKLVIGCLVVALIALATYLSLNRPILSPEKPKISSLAVLPLLNMTGDPEQEFFADGMTEALTTDLSKISALKVTSRTSAMRFKGTSQPVPEIAEELGVDAVVTGSVLREGDRVGIRTQLIEASTEQNIWAESYERDLTSILSLQSEIAQAIAEEIEVKLTPGEATQLAASAEVDPAAYEAFLKGKFHLHRFTPQDLDRALQYFDLALENQSDYALAHWGVGMVWAYRMQMGLVAPNLAGPKGERSIVKALELDDELAEPHLGLALFRTWYEFDWESAESSFLRAIQMNSSYAEARVFYSHFLAIQGRGAESTEQIEEALRLDPLNPFFQGLYGVQLQMIGRDAEAIEVFQEVIAEAPGLGFGHTALAGALFSSGRLQEALDTIKVGLSTIGDQEARAAIDRGYASGGFQTAMLEAAETMAIRAETVYVEPKWIADLYDYAGETGRTLDWLERAYDERDPNLPYLSALPYSKAVNSDPRFEAMLQKLDLPRIH